MRPQSFTRFDRWGTNLGRLPVLSARHTEALDGTDSLSLSTLDELSKGDRVVWVDRQGTAHEHIVDSCERVHGADGIAVTSAECINSVAELWDDWVDDKRPSGSVRVALASVLAGTRWAPGMCDQPGIASIVCYHKSAREALADVLERWGGELETTIETDGVSVTGRFVSVRSIRGDQGNPKRFSWAKDVKEVAREVGAENPKTRVYAYGKGVETDSGGYGRRLNIASVNNGVEYVEDSDATRVWGTPDGAGGYRPAVGSYLNDQCEDPAQLKAEALAYLEAAKQPRVTYRASVVDLSSYGRDWEGVGLGDSVAIVDKGFAPGGLRLRGRVSEITRDLVTGDTDVSFGTIVDEMADMWQSTVQQLHGASNSQAVTDAIAGGAPGWLETLQSALNDKFNVAGTYKMQSFELGDLWSNVPLDPETGKPKAPTSDMWCININGMGIRMAAGLTPAGEWDWRTLGTGKGLVADLINAGTLNADLIRAGTITDGEGGNYWDLDSGEFVLASKAIVDNGLVKDDEAVASVATEYALGESRTAAPVTGWATATPAWTAGLNVWQRTVLTLADGTQRTSAPVCIQGAEGTPGANGLPGTNGTNGKSSYVHIKYSAVAEPEDADMTEVPAEYIGICVTDEQSDPTTASSYQWSKWEGHDGAQGIQGPPGIDGTSTYVHFAYATSADGTQGFALEPFAGAKYVGVRTDTTEADSTRPGDYQWSLIQGADGTGVSALVPEYYLSTSQVEPVGGTWGTSMPSWQQGHYLWTRSKVTWTSGSVTHTDAVLAKAINGANQSASDANSAVQDLDSALTQQEIFDRLTNGGVTQGIYLQDGKLYLNGEFLQAGSIKVIDITANSTTAKCKVNIDTTKGLQILDLNNNLIAGTKINGSKTRFYAQAVGVDDNYLQCDWQDSSGSTWAGLTMIRGGVNRFGIVPVASVNGAYGVALTVGGKYVATFAATSSSSQGYEAGVCIHTPCSTFVPVESSGSMMRAKKVRGIAITSNGVTHVNS